MLICVLIGYSGVVIYTRNSVCAPIRAEEGITGILTPPNSSISFRDLPEDQQIGGYPTLSQLAECPLDAVALDSEGRCVVLEFPAFVLIGLYCPANRDESRDDFRIAFLYALDARVRNLVAAGKRVIMTGDINISRDEIDTAMLVEHLKKHEATMEQYLCSPARRMFNHLLVGGRVIGERDEGREQPLMRDLGRHFNPDRRSMFTCWEQKKNARPGNYGSRIDYVLCNEGMADWFCHSDIQEGLMGSDHCPVYAVLKEKTSIDGEEVHVRDLMSTGMYKDGNQVREWSTKDLLPLSAKLIPEFDRRRNIRDMFARKPTINLETQSSISDQDLPVAKDTNNDSTEPSTSADGLQETVTKAPPSSVSQSQEVSFMRPAASPAKRVSGPSTVARPLKRTKSSLSSKATGATKDQSGKGQSSLMGFFKPKPTSEMSATNVTKSTTPPSPTTHASPTESPSQQSPPRKPATTAPLSPSRINNLDSGETKDLIDPIAAKESWSKLLGKRVLPRCEHNESCVNYVTKKAGINSGRSFFMCPRPLGPSGQKEKSTEWRCGTFIWSSDWGRENCGG